MVHGAGEPARTWFVIATAANDAAAASLACSPISQRAALGMQGTRLGMRFRSGRNPATLLQSLRQRRSTGTCHMTHLIGIASVAAESALREPPTLVESSDRQWPWITLPSSWRAH
jgi:hypothetical protein